MRKFHTRPTTVHLNFEHRIFYYTQIPPAWSTRARILLFIFPNKIIEIHAWKAQLLGSVADPNYDGSDPNPT